MPASAPTSLYSPANIAVIYTNDQLVHIFDNPEDVTRLGPNFGLPEVGLEFFDAEGYRLAPIFNSVWQIVSLRRTNDQPNLEGVVSRIDNWFASIREYSGAATEAQIQADFTRPGDLDGVTAAQVLAALRKFGVHAPSVEGKPLTEVFNTARNFLDSGYGGNRGNFWHNALHAIGR